MFPRSREGARMIHRPCAKNGRVASQKWSLRLGYEDHDSSVRPIVITRPLYSAFRKIRASWMHSVTPSRGLCSHDVRSLARLKSSPSSAASPSDHKNRIPDGIRSPWFSTDSPARFFFLPVAPCRKLGSPRNYLSRSQREGGRRANNRFYLTHLIEPRSIPGSSGGGGGDDGAVSSCASFPRNIAAITSSPVIGRDARVFVDARSRIDALALTFL